MSAPMTAPQPNAAAELAAKIARIERLHAENQADEHPSFERLAEAMAEVNAALAEAAVAMTQFNVVAKTLNAALAKAFPKGTSP